MARTVHVEAPTTTALQAKGSPPTLRYIAPHYDVPDNACVGDTVIVEGKRARVVEASEKTVVVIIDP